MAEPAYRSLRAAAIADVGRAIAMTAAGVALFAVVELALTWWTYWGAIALGSDVRLVALVATLSLGLWLVLTVLLAGAMIATRLARAAFDPVAARGPGWFVAAPLHEGVRSGVPRLWAICATAGVISMFMQHEASAAIAEHKDGPLIAVYIAGYTLVAIAIAVPVRYVARIAADAAAKALAPILGALNPLGRWRAGGVALAAVFAGSLAAAWFVLPESRSYLSIRIAISGVAIALGMGIGARLHAQRKPRRRTKRRAFAIAGAGLVLSVGTLWQWGGDGETKGIAISASPALDKLIDYVRIANDLDGDGFGSLLGENDCAPFDASIHPGAKDIPDDGIDQNCDGHDFSLRSAIEPTGPTLPVPPQFKRTDWNFLFITVDTLRYDHTTFGGYKDAPKHRDTTPRLADFVKQSTSFTFCNAPSAGTMASIPAIITSKYFHSGIALDENVPKGAPPRLKPENTLLMEIMKRGGYHTGVIASHEYWNDWGMDQGVDDYDNSIGKTPDPFRVAADKVTDHALAWITRQQGHKWFLWAHYIDPHGRYVAHPDVVDYGSSEPDLYDAEIRWTDQEIGRLFDDLARMPSNEISHTIIVLTSDHGDSMAEHNVPLGTHGTALYYELQHVPMIFYVPDNAPHLIDGAVSNLDIVPTIAELAGIDVHDLSFEGKSEVPAIFYGKSNPDRIVFAETNLPNPQRAAISQYYKLIYYMHSNLYELFDLKADPTEHTNLASKHPPAFETMKTALDQWLERVVYARDSTFNQQTERIRDVLLAGPPAPPVATTGQTIADGKLVVAGIGVADNQHLVPGGKADIQVYFSTREHTDAIYKLQLVVWPIDGEHPVTDPVPANAVRSPSRLTADGFFPTDRWRPGETIRERFPVTIPADWTGELAVGLVATDATGTKARATGAMPVNDTMLEILGTLPLPAKPGLLPTDPGSGSSGSDRP